MSSKCCQKRSDVYVLLGVVRDSRAEFKSIAKGLKRLERNLVYEPESKQIEKLQSVIKVVSQYSQSVKSGALSIDNCISEMGKDCLCDECSKSATSLVLDESPPKSINGEKA